jgi:hypothetical protein
MRTALIFIILLTGIAGVAIADEPYDYAARWRAWDANSRAAYVSGVLDGIGAASITAFQMLKNQPSLDEQLQIWKALEFGSGIESKKIVEVISSIYQDPANSYITTENLVVLAQRKIQGENISKSLEDKRKAAWELHKASQRLDEKTKK